MPVSDSATNVLAHLEVYRVRLSRCREYLMANDQTNLAAVLQTLVDDCGTDRTLVLATTNVDTLTQ